MASLKLFFRGTLRSDESLDPDGLVIGRGDDVELRLDEPKLSRRHCSIVPDGKHWVLDDLGSRNGTFVNGRKEVRRELVDGDRIELGAWVLQFRCPEGEPVPIGLREEDRVRPVERGRTGIIPREGGGSEYVPQRGGSRSTEAVDPKEAARIRAEARTLLGPRLVERNFGAIHPLAKDRMVVGAGKDCDVSLTGIGFDEAAVLVRKSDGSVEIQKTGWISRVRVNGQGVSTAALQPGDVVRIGHVEFEFDNPLE